MSVCAHVCVRVCLCVSESEKGEENDVSEAYYYYAGKHVSASRSVLRFIAGVFWPKPRDDLPQ